MPAVVPREMVLEAYELKECGASAREISRALGIAQGAVARWLTTPDMNPHLDEIAIRRTFHGDASIYDTLTRFERDEVHRLLTEEWELTGREPMAEMWNRFGKDAARLRAATQKWRQKIQTRERRQR